MATVNLFVYQKGDSKLHKTHPTLKLLLLFVSSIIITTAELPILIYYLVIILLAFFTSRIKLSLLIKDLKYMLVIGTLLIIFQAVTSQSGVKDIFIVSSIYILRIGEILLLGTLLTATTIPSEITPGLYKIIRNKKIAENISLTIRLVPTFLISWKEIELSLNARGLYLIRNPFRFVTSITIPLLIETFKKADTISMAMESRCYNGWVKEEISCIKVDLIIIIFTLLPVLLQIKKLLPPDLLIAFSV